MSKILLIIPHKLDKIGGVSNYNKLLIKLFEKNGSQIKQLVLSDIDYDYIPKFDKKILKNKIYWKKFLNNKSLIKKFIYRYKCIKISRKIINKIDFSEFDLIIDSSNLFFNKLAKKINYFWVQHGHPSYYNGKVYKNFLKRIGIFTLNIIANIKNPFINNRNVVLFDTFNSPLNKNKNVNYFFIPISSFTKEEIINNKNQKIKDIKNNNIVFMGRLDNASKNISKLNDIANTGVNILVYGDGPDKNLLTSKNITLFGEYSKDGIKWILEKAKYSILVSNFEGFPYSIVESISYGVPVICLDSFPSAKFLIGSNERGFLLNYSEILAKINHIKNLKDSKYNKLVDNCFNFAIDKLNLETFESSWINILKMYSND